MRKGELTASGSGGEPFLPGLDLRPMLAEVAASAAAFVPDALDEPFRALLDAEVAAGPLRHYREHFGQVRQQIEGFDLEHPFEGFPRVAELCRALTLHVRAQGEGIRGLRSWQVNQAGFVLYRPGSIGITPHLDGRRYRRLVVVVTLAGEAELSICRDRSGTKIAVFDTQPGSMMLLRGPGLAGLRDGRPLHAVNTPRDGERRAIGLRMAVPRQEDSVSPQMRAG
jgi:hypothetical protein